DFTVNHGLFQRKRLPVILACQCLFFCQRFCFRGKLTVHHASRRVEPVASSSLLGYIHMIGDPYRFFVVIFVFERLPDWVIWWHSFSICPALLWFLFGLAKNSGYDKDKC